MSINTDAINDKLSELSLEELLDVQEKLTAQVRQRISTQFTSSSATEEPPLLLHLIPGAYRPSPEEIDQELRELFKDEYDAIKARAKDFDPAKLPPLPRRIVEYIDEDREDMPLPKISEKDLEF